MRVMTHNLQSGAPHEQASLLWAPGQLLQGWPHSWALILRNNGVGMQGARVAAASLLGEATPGPGSHASHVGLQPT